MAKGVVVEKEKRFGLMDDLDEGEKVRTSAVLVCQECLAQGPNVPAGWASGEIESSLQTGRQAQPDHHLPSKRMHHHPLAFLILVVLVQMHLIALMNPTSLIGWTISNSAASPRIAISRVGPKHGCIIASGI